MVEKTKLTLANATKSLRTTVPIQIIRQLHLEQGDVIVWNLDKISGRWIAMIRKE